MASNVHEEAVSSQKGGKSPQLYGRLEKPPAGRVANFWRTWSEDDRPMEQAVTCADAKGEIVAKEVTVPPTNGLSKIS